jgi:DUF4097 and DUF4098 domain-containing protein YvlB
VVTDSTRQQEENAMTTFDTPNPISVSVTLLAGDVRIAASDRNDTAVVVTPTDSSNESDVKVAEQTRVEYSNGALLIKAPKPRYRAFSFRNSGSIDVAIEVPAESQVSAETSVGDLSSDGRLGESRFVTGVGNIRLDRTGPLQLNTGTGTVIVGSTSGRTEITGAGDVRIRKIDGPAVVKNLNGDTWVGEITGDLRCNAANGDITVDRAQATVVAKTSNGDVRIGEVERGSVAISTAYGELEIGIREGTAALLDVGTKFGNVRNSLTASEGPDSSGKTVEVRARTSFGDIVIKRSNPSLYQEND